MLSKEVKVEAIQSSIPQEQSERIIFEVFDLLLGAGNSAAGQIEPDKEAKNTKETKV